MSYVKLNTPTVHKVFTNATIILRLIFGRIQFNGLINYMIYYNESSYRFLTYYQWCSTHNNIMKRTQVENNIIFLKSSHVWINVFILQGCGGNS